MKVCLSAFLAAGAAVVSEGFVPQGRVPVVSKSSRSVPAGARLLSQRGSPSTETAEEDFVFDMAETANVMPLSPELIAASAAAVSLLNAPEALAKGGEYGLVEGKTISILHPIGMITLFGISLYAAFTGWSWRNVRGLGDDVKELSKQIPTVNGKKVELPISIPITKLNADIKELREKQEQEGSDKAALEGEISKLQKLIDDIENAKPIIQQVNAASNLRKALISENFRDKHWNAASIVLAAGVFFAVEGPLNTYARAGKLFPGPHLFAGAAIPVLWALSASLVPQMQKGKDWARTAHIALNFGATALFAWQLVSGWEIFSKVWEKTQWP
uniref:DUF4079 domain-containing protein n=1 Tax=Chromera velia CCMP2878 TaxID=1169474 RepID=A0A0G4IF34_9ALVE|mmetsp:Transcript_16284/g.33024  ORF Transcript_16284/g.33024 Transcript_16284/m.33024 type:complete len:330 (+) Transcript_16284:160-1149(+)|eukprot:Cvel_13768.t1-p1 / transcript=Cvel_13768.t1 / gene=Cvel_13768 / organism=Chromera_velia_CCMP2878 / gene_product=hypothetical protein / transcript_product=hypothetical protein / location=Cvel_scaffold953:57200-60440(-) / protein_length=329 / sequence_SO=supercontig / SO=protein_coding / is_pseudo=false